MRKLAFWMCCAGFACVSAVSLGCRGRSLLPPPGPIDYQQGRAVLHDPFPQNDIGVEEKAARPPSYQKPLAEPVRDRLYRDGSPWWFFGQ
ncbi:membrane or secreted protein [Roseimaritima sediminicola]|uniref:membrane or secreted protein n=1 Tax=Roseimaritima sediminicola TaxID=2662066 RepID=UPI001F30F913|nr:membrane or secreted protein [Roseimaritima sediminicola]